MLELNTIPTEGKVSSGVAQKIKEKLKELDGQPTTITIDAYRRKRSLDQNAYYWSTVVEMARKEMNELGNNFSAEQTHNVLRDQVGLTEILIFDDMPKEYLKSTRDLDTKEFNEYIERAIAWCGSELGITIPEPRSN